MTKDIGSFFILSNPRSGSSLLRIILESHPNITVPPECGFIQWWHSKYKDWNKESSKDYTKIQEFCTDLESSKKIETYDLDFDLLKKNIKTKIPVTYAQLMALVFETYGTQTNKQIKVWGDKNNYYIHHLSLIHKLYPNTKYIHLIRDGRDVAISYKNLKNIKTNSPYVPKLPEQITEIATEWNRNNQKVLSFLKTVGRNNFLVVKYEDLILRTEKQLKILCDFLGVDLHKDMLQYYQINSKKNLEPKLTLDWKKKTLFPPDKSLIGRYKTQLTSGEIKKFNSIAEKTLFDYNYV